ncbi:DUF1467 family protein [Pseudokordiimonas caeni]|uniref:DUF1467 family protein n=1 Tax=Pseudokordiimonas caeni TaxID=2997908 RepID=UPI0028114873|nr:DUF1467 family protein [Pseudokordiimonas caeni]
MSIPSIILIYVVIWWLAFFPILSTGIKSHEEAGDKAIDGEMPGAPANPNLGKKIIITSLVAAVGTLIFYLIATSGLISFRDMAR